MAPRKRSSSSRKKLPQNSRALLSMWDRVIPERMTKEARSRLIDQKDNHVSCSIPAHYSAKTVIIRICEKAQIPIPIASLPPQLGTLTSPRGIVVFGTVWSEIDNIACNYPNMYWWISEHGLMMDTVVPSPPTDFDHVAGRLVSEMRKKSSNGRITKDQYSEIAADLDRLKEFKPRDVLPKNARITLDKWIEENGTHGLETFFKVIQAKIPRGLGRQLKKRLYRAREKFEREKD